MDIRNKSGCYNNGIVKESPLLYRCSVKPEVFERTH